MISAASLRTIFDENGVRNIVIIDDAFDRPGESFSSAECDSLFQQLTETAELRAALDASKVIVKESADLTALALQRLKKAALSGASGASVAWELVEATMTGKRAKLNRLADQMRKNLRVKVKSVSSHAAKSAPKVVPDDSNVIFLDYSLKPEDTTGELSARVVSRIYEQFKSRDSVPLLILMSSMKLSEDDISTFQSNTKLLSGMFYFVPKDELFNEEKLHYRLAAFGRSLSTGRVIQNFMHQVETSLETVREDVFKTVRKLSIADYGYLQMLRLHDDGQPLGEYLLWMIGSSLVRDLGCSAAVRSVEAKLNKLEFDHLPPTNAKPSASLGALYSSAVIRPVDDLPTKPISQAEYLQFGDLFRKDDALKVWVCLTPPCDLAFSPKRPIPSDRSILFLPGKLRQLSKPLTEFEQRQPRTELIELSKELYRVVWDTKGVKQTQWSKIKTWQTDAKVKRVARLTTPFALEVQRGFASDLTRIGMPVPPPIYQPVTVRLTCKDQGGELELTKPEWSDALKSGSERGVRFVLGARFMDELPGMLAAAQSALQSSRDLLSSAKSGDPGPLAQAEKALGKIKEARTDAVTLSSIRGPHQLTSVGQPQYILGDIIAICDAISSAKVDPWVPLRLEIIPVISSVGGAEDVA